MWSRCRHMRGSSSSAWKSRASIPSKASRRRWRSNRRTRRDRRDRRWAPATEIYDYLRLLWARVGRTYCRVCGRELRPDTVESVTDAISSLPAGTRFLVACPLVRSARVTHDVIEENLRARGFVRVSVDGEVLHLDDLGERIDLATARDVLVVIDRLRVDPADTLATGRRGADRISTRAMAK